MSRQPAPASAAALEQALVERMPERPLLGILCNVQHWVQFTRGVGPLSGNEPKLREVLSRYLLTVYGYGCNLGPTQTARHARCMVTPRTLMNINAHHITADKLDAAIRDIINHFNRFDLPHYWDSGKGAAAEGTQFDLYRINLLAEQHIRYGGYGGIAYYHLSDIYIALFSSSVATA